MSTRAEAIATELQYHHTQPGLTCTCGYKFRPGEWISLHRAKAADIAIELWRSGIEIDDLHIAVVGTRKLAGGSDAVDA
ncbi:hypothetical protein [Curtobacterium sp. MCLR17_034]|uniref:hypothetical protein n=1 Tax=Curtobacterium sp. MCLR17_034 TaxID=2175623 RepID=UPI0011B36F8D|nr:hypothetical protein [Curtobacterium sp. MCLR17_034]